MEESPGEASNVKLPVLLKLESCLNLKPVLSREEKATVVSLAPIFKAICSFLPVQCVIVKV